jgi:hypothetical protein
MSTPRLALLTLIALAWACAASAAAPPLTPDGWGKLRIGMRESDAVRQFHLRISRNDGVSSYECRVDAWPGRPDVEVMARNGRISRIETDGRVLHTEKGFGVGSREADLRTAYGHLLEVATAAYMDEPAHDLTYWRPGRKRGILYGTDEHGRVVYVRAGDRSITYIEGCL